MLRYERGGEAEEWRLEAEVLKEQRHKNYDLDADRQSKTEHLAAKLRECEKATNDGAVQTRSEPRKQSAEDWRIEAKVLEDYTPQHKTQAGVLAPYNLSLKQGADYSAQHNTDYKYVSGLIDSARRLSFAFDHQDGPASIKQALQTGFGANLMTAKFLVASLDALYCSELFDNEILPDFLPEDINDFLFEHSGFIHEWPDVCTKVTREMLDSLRNLDSVEHHINHLLETEETPQGITVELVNEVEKRVRLAILQPWIGNCNDLDSFVVTSLLNDCINIYSDIANNPGDTSDIEKVALKTDGAEEKQETVTQIETPNFGEKPERNETERAQLNDANVISNPEKIEPKQIQPKEQGEDCPNEQSSLSNQNVQVFNMGSTLQFVQITFQTCILLALVLQFQWIYDQLQTQEEIYLCELITDSSDALDMIRHESLKAVDAGANLNIDGSLLSIDDLVSNLNLCADIWEMGMSETHAAVLGFTVNITENVKLGADEINKVEPLLKMDAVVNVMKMDKEPLEVNADIGLLRAQIQQIKESLEQDELGSRSICSSSRASRPPTSARRARQGTPSAPRSSPTRRNTRCASWTRATRTTRWLRSRARRTTGSWCR